jgi:hypothetical protein
LIFLRRRRTGVSGFRYFGISDTGSTRGQGIVAPGFTKFRNVNSRKHRRSIVGSRDRIRFRHTGVRDFGSPEDKESGNLTVKLPKSRNTRRIVEWGCGLKISYFGIPGFGISGILKTRYRSISALETPKFRKKDCDHGGHS